MPGSEFIVGPPKVAGWYWFMVYGATNIQGPVEVFDYEEKFGKRIPGMKLVVACQDGSMGFKAVDLFARHWAGPLARPTVKVVE